MIYRHSSAFSHIKSHKCYFWMRCMRLQ